jgi:hypothetical protein
VSGVKGFGFSNTNLICHLNSMPMAGGILDGTDLAAQAISVFECMTGILKLMSFGELFSLSL